VPAPAVPGLRVDPALAGRPGTWLVRPT